MWQVLIQTDIKERNVHFHSLIAYIQYEDFLSVLKGTSCFRDIFRSNNLCKVSKKTYHRSSQCAANNVTRTHSNRQRGAELTFRFTDGLFLVMRRFSFSSESHFLFSWHRTLKTQKRHRTLGFSWTPAPRPLWKLDISVNHQNIKVFHS